MAGELTLILGGVRSGKSAFAERLAAAAGQPVVYLATARADDAEMAARIAAHQARRPADWVTVEAPLDPAAAVLASGHAPGVLLLDSLSMLVTNLLLAEERPAAAADRLAAQLDALVALTAAQGWQAIVVSDEVGLGGVALHPLGRAFADLLGDANQRLASAATRTWYVLAGLAVEWSALARSAPYRSAADHE